MQVLKTATKTEIGADYKSLSSVHGVWHILYHRLLCPCKSNVFHCGPYSGRWL